VLCAENCVYFFRKGCYYLFNCVTDIVRKYHWLQLCKEDTPFSNSVIIVSNLNCHPSEYLTLEKLDIPIHWTNCEPVQSMSCLDNISIGCVKINMSYRLRFAWVPSCLFFPAHKILFSCSYATFMIKLNHLNKSDMSVLLFILLALLICYCFI
jgi:hypothetical protein